MVFLVRYIMVLVEGGKIFSAVDSYYAVAEVFVVSFSLQRPEGCVAAVGVMRSVVDKDRNIADGRRLSTFLVYMEHSSLDKARPPVKFFIVIGFVHIVPVGLQGANLRNKSGSAWKKRTI